MSVKRTSTHTFENKSKRNKIENNSVIFFREALGKCGLELKAHPDKCVASQDTIFISAKLKKTLIGHGDSACNMDNFFKGFKHECEDPKTFVHYVQPTVTQPSQKNCDNSTSVLEVLLSVTSLQSKLIGYIFDKVPILLQIPKFDHLIKNILKTFYSVDTIEYSEMSKKFIELIKLPMDESVKSVKEEIVSAIPDIIGKHDHSYVASELMKVMSDHKHLIPSILNCLTYLSLSDCQFENLHMEILETMQVNKPYLSTFVKFLLAPGRLSDSTYENIIMNLARSLQSLKLPDAKLDSKLDKEKFASHKREYSCIQVATAKAIRNSMISSKVMAKLWLKVISNCKDNTEHNPIDIIFFLILYSISDDMQKEVEKKMRTQIKLQILKEDLLEKAFKDFMPILNDNLRNLICLSNALLKTSAEPVVQSFASQMYMVMFSELNYHCREIIAGLLQLILNCKQSKLIALNILNNIACKNLYLLESQSGQILTLLDEMFEGTLTEIRSILNLVCGLAYGYPNSRIRNLVDINIRKYLGSSILEIKIRSILTGIYAIKYLMNNNTDLIVPDNVTLNMTSHFPKGGLSDAANIIKHINQSTQHFPHMRVFFYDELSNIIKKSTDINAGFLQYLVKSFHKEWEENFLLKTYHSKMVNDIRLTQLPPNENFSNDKRHVVNIAGIILENNEDISIDILSPLFQLVGTLHYKKENGNLSSIQEFLEYPIAMPAIDWNSIDDLSDSSVPKILDCSIHFVNFLRELLNAFATQKNKSLKRYIFKKLHLLTTHENNIEKIFTAKDITYKTPIYYSHVFNNGNSKEKVEKKIVKPQSNINFRPLSLTLIELIRNDLKPLDAYNTELTFEGLSYLLNHINSALEKILLPSIKKKKFFNKDPVELYSPLDAEIEAKIVSSLLLKLMAHIKVIMSFLDGFIQDDIIDLDSENATEIISGSLCLERIYNLLSIYFQWFEFKERHVPLLMTSLKSIAEVPDDEPSNMDYLLTTAIKNFQKQEKYCVTHSSAVSLIRLMCVLNENWAVSRETLMIKDLAQIFLTKQWKTPSDEYEKGLIYNQGLEIFIKAYFANNALNDLKSLAESLKNDVIRLRDQTSVLIMFKSINKSNFPKLFKNLGLSVYYKIKVFLNAEMSAKDLLVKWETVAIILKSMSDMVTNLIKKQVSLKKGVSFKNQMSLTYSKIFDVILKIFMTKGFPILEMHYQKYPILVKKVLKYFEMSASCLESASQSSLRANLTCLKYNTNELIGVPHENSSLKKNTKKLVEQIVYDSDESMVDSDDDSPHDKGLSVDDNNEYSSDSSQNNPISLNV